MAGSQLNKQELKRSGSTLVYWLTGPREGAPGGFDTWRHDRPPHLESPT